MPTEADAVRFWAKVEKSDGCWTWIASRAPGDYGRFQLGGRPHPAHRIAWMMANGPIPAGLHVLHRCDNPPCVRPDHLRLGSPADNTADKVARGRVNKHPRLSPAEPHRRGTPLTLAEAAVRLGLSPSTLRGQVNKGKLRARLVGKTYVVTERELERYRAESLGRRK